MGAPGRGAQTDDPPLIQMHALVLAGAMLTEFEMLTYSEKVIEVYVTPGGGFCSVC